MPLWTNMLLTVLLLSLIDTGTAQADSFRCGRKIIKTGDTSGDLVRTCGEPDHKDRSQERIRIDGVSKNARVERWYYRRSGRSLERIVYIYRGRVAAIDVGKR